MSTGVHRTGPASGNISNRKTGVRKRFQVLRRLAGQKRRPPPQGVHQQTRRSRTRADDESRRPPKTASGEDTLASVLLAEYQGRKTAWQAARRIIATAGSKPPDQLTKADVIEIDERLAASGFQQSTKAQEATGVRQILRWLHEAYGIPNLAKLVRRYNGVRPRNVTVTPDERDQMITAATPALRLWLLLCSDLAMRSGTAARVSSEHYNRTHREFRFTTKAGAALTLPATHEIAALLDTCVDNGEPYVRQLWRKEHRRGAQVRSSRTNGNRERRAFHALRKALGINRRIIPHDLRRTTAVAVLEATNDIRDVQAVLGHASLRATVHYLDHDLRPVRRSLLETIKRPAWAERKQA